MSLERLEKMTVCKFLSCLVTFNLAQVRNQVLH